MTDFTVILPLRVTPTIDFHTMLASWLDNPDNGANFTSNECQDDLQRLSQLRSVISETITTKEDSHEQALSILSQLHEYYHLLLECEQTCFPTLDPKLHAGQSRNQSLSQEQQDNAQQQQYPMPLVVLDNTNNNTTSSCSIQLPWQSALSSSSVEEEQIYPNLTMERLSILWNLISLEAYQATKQKLDSKVGWSKAAQHFQNAAVLIKYMLQMICTYTTTNTTSSLFALSSSSSSSSSSSLQQQQQQQQQQVLCIDFLQPFLELWQGVLVAESQRCVYQSLACAPRPRHLLLAKLAAAAVPLFNSCETLAQIETLVQQTNTNDNTNTSVSSLASDWADFVRAWGIFMSAKAEHHQACIHRDKHQWGLELARLDLAFRFANLCREFCDSTSISALQTLQETVHTTLQELKERMVQAEEMNSEQYKDTVPHRNDLTEIRGQRLVKLEEPLENIIKRSTSNSSSSSPALFTKLIIQSPNFRFYSDAFRKDMDKLVYQMASIAEERTESARKALATVNLPHSLTAYRQEQSGGGIPDDLWERVQEIQRERRIAKLKQDLWGLRDVAEAARTTYQKVESQLDFDLESDRLFRQANPGFEGHDAMEVQKTFRQSLANYDRLLATAQEGDSVLLRRLEILDTNPKYKLLQFQKSQLDRLLPSSAAVANNGNNSDNGNGVVAGPAIDTSHLSRLLVELSALFHEREVLLDAFKNEVKSYDIRSSLAQVDPRSSTADQDYRDTLAFAKRSFDGIVFEMQANIEKQVELVHTILAENERFMHAREMSQSSHSTSDSCIVMIEDAIEEIEQLSKHLKEGKDFYDVVIPKLEKLKQQVGDVSARLTVERLEHDDKAHRNRQEEEDAMLAKNMAEQAGSGSSSGGGGGRGSGPISGMGGLGSSMGGPGSGMGGRLGPGGSIGVGPGVGIGIGAGVGVGLEDGPPDESTQPDFVRHASQPGMAQVSHDVPQITVDDEKVATLVAMEFDPTKVVAALRKYDNNMEQALNDLLSC